MNGILLGTGTPWEHMPQELGFGSGMTRWRWLRDWQSAGVWHRLRWALLAELRGADKLDFGRACVDGASVPNPTGRGKPGSKRHLITDRQGIPLMFCAPESTAMTLGWLP